MSADPNRRPDEPASQPENQPDSAEAPREQPASAEEASQPGVSSAASDASAEQNAQNSSASGAATEATGDSAQDAASGASDDSNQPPPISEEEAQARARMEELRTFLSGMGRLHVEQPWNQLLANPLFRRTLAIRRWEHLWQHPLLRPIVTGLFLAIMVDAVEERALQYAYTNASILFVIFAVSVGIYFTAMGLQRVHCGERVRELRDSGALQHYFLSGMTLDETIMGIVTPYEVGDRLGFMTMMAYFAYMTTEPFMRWVIILFIAMNVLGLMARPILMGPHLEQYFATQRLASVWRIMLLGGVPLAIWFALMIGIMLLLGPILVQNGASREGALIICLVLAIIINTKISQRWQRKRLANFVRRRGSIEEMLEDYLEAAP
jgi:hypothetical protein